jgi:hypothetical protein
MSICAPLLNRADRGGSLGFGPRSAFTISMIGPE